MTTTIITKNSSTASAVPTTSDLVQGELAVNVTDKRLFTENASSTIVELGTNPSSITTGAITATGTVTANSNLSSSNAVLTGGTVNGIVIGGTTPSAITGTNITANTGFSGPLTGNVTGNLTGNVTGNITGDLTGNVTASSGTTTLNNLVLNGTVDFNTAVLTDLGSPVASTDAATKGYVDTQVANVIDSAPAALDTLNELAAALGDDANFSTTITNSIATKLPLAGGTMTGAIAMGSSKITGLADGTASGDAVNKGQLDTKLDLSGGTMTGNIVLGTNSITSTATPTTADELTRKGYVDSILGSATSAATSAAAAATSASNAATSESNASTSASNAATSATAAAASYDSFDDRYLGAKSSDPTLDNDGDALVTGATYFNTADNKMKVYTGSAWVDVAPVATSITASQISDVTATAAELNILDGVTATTAELNYVDGVTSNLQTQLDNISVTSGTLTKTFAQDEVATITLSSSITTPVVSVTKEVPQTGTTNSSWDVNSTTENYTRLDSAPATTLDFNTALSESSYTRALGVGSQDSDPEGLAFNTDGTKLFMIGRTGDAVYEYDLTTGFDLSTATYSQSFSVASQDGFPRDVVFNNDGTSMFVMGDSTNTVYQYTLTTGFDVSTASYASKSFVTTTQEDAPQALSFNSDGTKMFVVGSGTDTVYEYTLTTGFDVSTASYSSNSFSVTSQDTNPSGLFFSSDGTRMYIVGLLNDTVYKYNLTTGFDITTASLSSDSFSVASQDGTPNGVVFNSDETKMFIVGNSGNQIYEYSLGYASVSLGSGSFASADVGKTIEANGGKFVLTSTAGAYSETTAPTSYAQVASGSWEMYGVVYNTTDGDLELSNYLDAYNLSATTHLDDYFVGGRDGTPTGITFNADGTKLYLIGSNNDRIYEHNLSTAFDLTTISFSFVELSIGNKDGIPTGLRFNTDGTKLFFTGDLNNNVYVFNLSTGFDLSTASDANVSFSVNSQATGASGLEFNPDGTIMYVSCLATDSVYQYTLTTGFDVSTASYASKSLSVSGQEGTVRDLAISNDGKKLFIIGSNETTVFEYTLSTAYDVSTGSYSGNSYAVTQGSAGQGLAFDTTGKRMYTLTSGDQEINEFTVFNSYKPTGYHAVHTKTSTDSTYWTDINSMTADEAAGDGSIFYCVSTDDRSTWKIAKASDGERSIVRNNSGTWQYNSNGTYASTTWTNATTNTELNALQEAMTGASYSVGYSISSMTFNQYENVITGNERDVFFKPDGLLMIVLANNGYAYEYTLTTAFDVSTASYDSVSYANLTGQSSNVWGLYFKSDGTKMYVTDLSNIRIMEYALSTAWDVTTASYTDSLSTSGVVTQPLGMVISSDGLHMVIAGNAGVVYYYTLGTAWDVSSATYQSSLTGIGGGIRGVAYNSDGTKLFTSDYSADIVKQFSLSTAYDVSTGTYDNISYDTTANGLVTPVSLHFANSGQKLYIVDQDASSAGVYEFDTVGTVYTNQMNKTQLDAVSDANHFTLANDLDLGIIFNLSSGTTVPSSDGVSINYDANVLNKGAILGTDYDFDAPAATKVRITALAANNLKVRVV